MGRGVAIDDVLGALDALTGGLRVTIPQMGFGGLVETDCLVRAGRDLSPLLKPMA